MSETKPTVSEIEWHIQPGPCRLCGRLDYPLSMGGPTICPSCDCAGGNPDILKAHNEKLQRRIETLLERNRQAAECFQDVMTETDNGKALTRLRHQTIQRISRWLEEEGK